MPDPLSQQAEATHAAAQPPLESSTPGPSTRRPVAKSTDPFANYSTAASLGFVDTEADVRAALEAEEEERKRIGEAGQWETIAVHEPSQAVEGEAEGSGAGYRLGSVQRENAEDSEDIRNFQFDEVEAVPARAKRRIHDVYGGDQFDPDALLRTTTFIDETKRQKEARVERETQEKGLNRDRWMGLVLGPDGKPVIKEEVVKEEATPPEPRSEHAAASAHASVDVLVPATNVKPLPDEDVKPSTSSGGLFKKRKVPVTSRSTRQR
jgi:WW domain-binding protein 4